MGLFEVKYSAKNSGTYAAAQKRSFTAGLNYERKSTWQIRDHAEGEEVRSRTAAASTSAVPSAETAR